MNAKISNPLPIAVTDTTLHPRVQNVKAEPFEMPSMVYWIREIVYERVYKCLD
jgi:hypothetical protein